jgi:protein gp37
MSAKTSIEWTDRSWNPVRGCSVVSAGCKNCYAMKVAARFSGPGLAYEELALRSPARWTGKVRLVADDLDAPLRWSKAQRIFVNSMSDLFHEGLSDEQIDRVFAVMLVAQSGGHHCRRSSLSHDHDSGDCSGPTFAPHTFQVLTKRAGRMRAYLSAPRREDRVRDALHTLGWSFSDEVAGSVPWPIPNVWLGVSVEDQRAADERIPLLLQTPAALRFLSVEPLLGPVDFEEVPMEDRCYGVLGSGGGLPGIDWVIVGGESGPGARPCSTYWIRDIVAECAAARVPCFVKQLGSRPLERNDCITDRWPGADVEDLIGDDSYEPRYQGELVTLRLRDRKGGDPAEWPDCLRVRAFPASSNLRGREVG